MRIHLLSLAWGLCSLASATTIGSRQTSLSTTAPAGWVYQGCYSDSTTNRVIPPFSIGSGMSHEQCAYGCTFKFSTYTVVGLEYGDECYCGHFLDSSAVEEPDTDCNMPCSGNSAEACGGPNRITVYSRIQSTGTTTNPGPNGWVSLGCYYDNTSYRTLENPTSVAGEMTVAGCTAQCKNLGYQYAGLEYADECYCGDALRQTGTNPTTLPSSSCNMPCNGNTTEFCGGSGALNVYQFPTAVNASSFSSLSVGWSSLRCYTDSVSARTLSHALSVPGGSSNMTVESCLSACHGSGYSLAGLEYSQECWCDDQLQNGGSRATDQTACNMHCTGNGAELCGGSNRLNMYQYGSSSPSSTGIGTPSASSSTLTKTSSTTSSITSSTAISSVTTPTITPSPTITTSQTSATSTTSYACTTTNPSGYVQDGDFESPGLGPWTATVFEGTANVSVTADSYSFYGCSELAILPTTVTNNQYEYTWVILSQTVTVPTAGQYYNFSMWQGWDRDLYETFAPELFVDNGNPSTGEPVDGYACQGRGTSVTCDTTTYGGRYYKGYTGQMYAPSTSFKLSINVRWMGMDYTPGNRLLIDGISLR